MIWDPIRGLHQGQRPRAAQTGRTHGSTRPFVVYVDLTLRQRGRPHMTDERIALRELLEKGSDATFLREMIGFAAQRLMELECRGPAAPPMASAAPSG